MKLVGRQSAGRQCRDKRTRSGNRFHPKTGCHSVANDSYAGIADPRSAGISDNCNFLAGAQPIENLSAAAGFVELEIAQHRFGNSKMMKQVASVARIFGGNHVTFFKNAQCPQCDVLQITDGSSNEVERARLKRWKLRWKGAHSLSELEHRTIQHSTSNIEFLKLQPW